MHHKSQHQGHHHSQSPLPLPEARPVCMEQLWGLGHIHTHGSKQQRVTVAQWSQCCAGKAAREGLATRDPTGLRFLYASEEESQAAHALDPVRWIAAPAAANFWLLLQQAPVVPHRDTGRPGLPAPALHPAPAQYCQSMAQPQQRLATTSMHSVTTVL